MRNIVIYRSSLCVTKELGELHFSGTEGNFIDTYINN